MMVKNRPEQDCSSGGNASITSVDTTGKKIHHHRHHYRRPGGCLRIPAVATTVCCIVVLEYQSILQSLFVLKNSNYERSTLTNYNDNDHPKAAATAAAAAVDPYSITILRMMESASSSRFFNTSRVVVKQQVDEQPSHHPKEEETRKQNPVNINNKNKDNNNNDKNHKMTPKEQPPSMVRFHACCGLGHRLQRMAGAHYVAKARFHFGLTGIWGKCHKTNLFSYLFEPEEEDAATAATNNSTSPRGTLVNIHNEAAGFRIIGPPRASSPCPCPDDQIQLDYQFYQSLRNRFRFRDKVEQFRLDHGFDQHTVIGIQIRAGNGEQGQFLQLHRGILDPESFRRNLIAQLQEKFPTIMSNNSTSGATKPPLIYVASDTLSMIQQLRNEIHNVTNSSNTTKIVPTNATTATTTLQNDIPVVDYPHIRIDEGNGVRVNNIDNINNTNSSAEESCLNGWRDALMDMILLSSADVVVATSYSSFTQSMPLSVVMQESSFPTPFCELETVAPPPSPIMTVLDPQAPPQQELQCFRTYQEWCSESKSKKTGRVPNKDYWDLPDSIYKIQTVQQ